MPCSGSLGVPGLCFNYRVFFSAHRITGFQQMVPNKDVSADWKM